MSLGGATIIFALLLGALVCASEIAPLNHDTGVAVPASKEERPAVAASSKCALETWPNITADCLRNADAGHVGNARLIVAGQQ
ncbi:MAG: hypothetical protein J0H42_35315 [Rhizobiales bacterium]|nr:hypothetical protein [Hyphomicrobiales bacterium]